MFMYSDYSQHLLDHVKKIHFIGCGGSGMYPLIQILAAKGYELSGSDVLDGSIIRYEREMGVKVSLGHNADNVVGADMVVYSAAISKDNVELNAAASYGIPTVERSVLLGYVSRLYKQSICVSGTHGKTTTTSMITTALELAGRDPSAVIGGKLPLINGYGKAGKCDDIVIEACEFAETFLKLTPNALISTHKDTIFTNVALDLSDNTVWWEGLNKTPPARAIDWRGRPWTPQSPEKAAHPNSRFTAPAANCPCLSKEFNNPNGVPVTAMVFGGRRAKTAPLVYQSFNWQHGVFIGSIMASETTAAATGRVGVVRRDPMAMLPFCGYHMGDYWQHWLDMGEKLPNAPKIFNVNWFRTDEDGNFAWPGFGDNMRVLQWIISRADDEIGAAETALGYEPNTHDIDMEGLEMSMYDMRRLLSVDRDLWLQECEDAREYYEKIGKVPPELYEELDALEMRLNRGYKVKHE